MVVLTNSIIKLGGFLSETFEKFIPNLIEDHKI